MMAGATNLYNRMDEWKGEPEAAFLDEGLAVHPGGGEGAAGLTQGIDVSAGKAGGRGFGGVRPFTNAPC